MQETQLRPEDEIIDLTHLPPPKISFAKLPNDIAEAVRNDELFIKINRFFKFQDDYYRNKEEEFNKLVEEDLKSKGFPYKKGANVFLDSSLVCNHMVSCRVFNIKKYKEKLNLNLPRLQDKIKNAFFCPKRISSNKKNKGVQSMLIYDGKNNVKNVCSVLFTRKGILTVSGGYHEDDVKVSLFFYLKDIFRAINEIQIEDGEKPLKLSVTDIILKNRTCTNKLIYQSIEISSLIDYFKELGMVWSYNPNSIGILNFYPLSTNKNTNVLIFSAGGVNVTGFCPFYVAQKALEVLSSILPRFLRSVIPRKLCLKDLNDWNVQREKDRVKTERQKYLKKLRKIEFWRTCVNEHKKTDTYDNWITNHCLKDDDEMDNF